MKQAAAVILIGLTVFLTTFLVFDHFWGPSAGDLAAEGSNPSEDGSTDGDPSSAGASPETGQDTAVDRTQDGGNEESVQPEAADNEESLSPSISPPASGDVNSGNFGLTLERLTQIETELNAERERLVEDQNNKNVNDGLLERIQEEKAEIEKLKQDIQQGANPTPSPGKKASDDDTPDPQQAAETAKPVVGPQTAKIWADRWSELDPKLRTFYIKKLVENDGLADVIVILQLMKPAELAETLAQLAKEDEQSAPEGQGAAGQGTAPENGNQGLAARLVMAMMNTEKNTEKNTQQ